MNDLLQENIAGWLRSLNLPDPEIDYDTDGVQLDIAFPEDQLGLRIDEHQETVSWNGWTVWLCQNTDQAFEALSEIASRLGISPNYQVVDLSRIEAIFAQGLFDSALAEIDALQLPESHPQYDTLKKLKTRIRNEKRRASRGQNRQQVETSSFVERLRHVPTLQEAQFPDHNFFGFYDSQPNLPEGIDAVWIASCRQGAIDVWAAAAAGRPALASDPDFIQESTEINLLRHTIEKLDGATTFIWDNAEVIPLLRTWHYRDNGSDLPSSCVFVDLRTICLVAFPQAKRTDSPESLCQELKLEFRNSSGQGSPLAAMIVLLSTCIEQFQSFDVKLQSALHEVLNRTSLRGEWLDYMLTIGSTDEPFFQYIKYLITHYENLPAPVQKSNGERHAHGLNVDDFLQNNGVLAQVQGEQYRVRPSQIDFARRVAEALHSPQPYLLEAGTGVGKTIGYVIPLLLRGRRAYVATHTKNLQDQAWVKDIPTVLNAFRHAGIGRSVSILKGKSNYFSPQALENALADLDGVIGTSESQAFTFAALLHWAVTTSTGFLSELEGAGNPNLIGYFSREKTSPGDNGTWAQIDPYRRALEVSQNADLVLVNQSLVFALAKLEQPQPGEVDTVVFDEAHNLEDVATDALTLNFDAWSIQAEISSLLDRDPKGRVRGLLRSIIEPGNIKQNSVLQEFRKSISDVEAVLDTWCQVCRNRLEEISKFRTELDEETPMLFEFSEFWQGAFQQLAIELSQKLEHLTSVLTPLIEILPDLHGIPHSLTNRIQSALSSLLEHVTDGGEALRGFLADDPEWIRWGEANIVRTDNDQLPLFAEPLALQGVLHCTPLDVSSWLKTTLPNLYAHRIYVSATLAVGSNFSSISRRLGLTDDAPTADVFPSPYNLREQALLAVPTDIPSPQSGTDSLYIEALSRNIAGFVKLSKGYALVLFTSRRTMNEVAPRLQALLSETGISVLAQNAHNRSAIAERFRLAPIEGEKLVLLGLRAFWEGVDFPGALKLLIITRLPFDFTGHPVAAARRIHYLAQGFDRDFFREVVIPRTLLHLRQMIGRLIRREQDKGVCIIADPRIQARLYGRYMLSQLLDSQKSIGRCTDVLDHVREFLETPGFVRDYFDPEERVEADTELSLEQQAITQSLAQRMMVEATAGSGKTRVLVERIVQLIKSGKAKADQILVLTFTNKARNVMRERLEKMLDAETALALENNVLTYHRFAARVIRSAEGDNLQFLDELQDRQSDLIATARKAAGLSPSDLPDEDAVSIVSFAQNGLIDEDELEHIIPQIDPALKQLAKFFIVYVTELRRNNWLDYGEALVGAVQILRTDEVIRQSWSSRFKWIFCDEYQDTSPAQAALISLIGQYANILVVGDSVQSIYSWQGADPDNLRRFTQDFPGAASFVLSKNFRSFPNLVRTAETFLRNVGQLKGVAIHFDERRDLEKQKVYFLSSRDEYSEASSIAGLARKAQMMGLSVSVLARTWALLVNVEEQCIKHEVPYKFEGETSYSLATHPGIKPIVERAIQIINQDALQQPTGDSADGRLIAALREKRIISADQLLRRTAQAVGEPQKQRNAQREFDQFVSLWEGKPYTALRALYGEAQPVPAVVLSTIHSQKGEEFDVVFVIGAEQGNLPHTPPHRHDQMVKWRQIVQQRSKATWRASLTRADIESLYQREEERLFYVAMTRAIGNLVVCFAEQRGEPSEFLKQALLDNTVITTDNAANIEIIDPRIQKDSTGYKTDGRVYLTNAGVRVRSKSEMLLANEFHRRGMYFEYEVPATGITDALPDFTFPDYGGIILEHLGMLDNEDYRRRWELKAQQYRDHSVPFFSTTEKDIRELKHTVDELQRQFVTLIAEPDRLTMISRIEIVRRQCELHIGRAIGTVTDGLFQVDNNTQYVAIFVPLHQYRQQPDLSEVDGTAIQWDKLVVGDINTWVASRL